MAVNGIGPLTQTHLRDLLGGIRESGPPEVRVESEVSEDGYVRRHVTYPLGSERASACVCLPRDVTGAAPIIFCHHQHAGRFDLGKARSAA